MIQAQCDLCSSISNLSLFQVEPKDEHITVCGTCNEQLSNPAQMDANHWRCLSVSMWSEKPAVQVMAWRVLNLLRKNESWAGDLFEQLYLDEELQTWASAMSSQEVSKTDQALTKDSNGAILNDGDAITLTKDLDVKGANFTAKRGTLVKNISLTNNPEHIEGKVNGTHIVILTCFTKKA